VGKAKTEKLSAGWQGDRDWWLWLIQLVKEGRGRGRVVVERPMWRRNRKWPKWRVYSDAAITRAIGGYWEGRGWWWRWELPEEVRGRCMNTVTNGVVGVADWNVIDINLLELLAMIITVWMILVVGGERPADNDVDAAIMMLGDNTSAVSWINKKGSKCSIRAAAVMRLLGMMEVVSGFHFDGEHIAGILNVIADGISRWADEEVQNNLTTMYPLPNGQEWERQQLTQEVLEFITKILGPASGVAALTHQLRISTSDISVSGRNI
jgi:hypothetical protein